MDNDEIDWLGWNDESLAHRRSLEDRGDSSLPTPIFSESSWSRSGSSSPGGLDARGEKSRRRRSSSLARIKRSSKSSSRRRPESPPNDEADGQGDRPPRRHRSLGPSSNLADLHHRWRRRRSPSHETMVEHWPQDVSGGRGAYFDVFPRP